MNLFALSTGFILEPKRVIAAFYRGCRSKNLYYMADNMTESDVEYLTLTEVRQGHLEIRKEITYLRWRQFEFLGYVLISLLIHVVMLVVGKTLLVLEAIKNKIFSP